MLAAARAALGSDALWEGWLPLVVAVETVMLARYWLAMRDALVRLVPVTVGVVSCLLLDGYLHQLGPLAIWWPEAVRGGVYGGLGAIILFPILDGLKPVLRSYAYPL